MLVTSTHGRRVRLPSFRAVDRLDPTKLGYAEMPDAVSGSVAASTTSLSFYCL
jgi:hypothetical protein